VRPRVLTWHVLIAAALVCCAPAGAQWAAGGSAGLRARIAAVVQKHLPEGAEPGILVHRLGAAQPIYALNPRKPLIPASNMKLFTTAAALDVLGSKYAFRTRVLARGEIRAGVLHGDLVLKGSGDPNISGRFHDGDVLAIPRAWARKVADAGIRTIAGDLVADDSLFDRQYTCPSWPKDQLDRWYAAGVCALSFNDNCIWLTTGPGAARGQPAIVSLSPRNSRVTLVNRATTGPRGARVRIGVGRRPGEDTIRVTGTYPAGREPVGQWVTVGNPALYLGAVFRDALAREGVTLAGRVRLIGAREPRTGAHEIAVTVSSLKQTIAIANKRSQNFYAEQILKALGAHVHGKGSYETGRAVVRAFAERTGIGKADLCVEDGSGLSRRNRASAWAVVTLLRHMAKHAQRQLFIESLAAAGVDGTLRRRLRDAATRGKIRAKTGTIAGVRCLSGYATGASGARYAFSIMVNGVRSGGEASRLQDQVCRVLVTEG